MPGETAEFEVSIANHGRWPALFEISIEGWIDEAWTPELPLRVQLEPLARQVVKVAISPPRQPDCHAGEHPLVVVVRAARYPGHVTRLAATLVVERFASLKLGTPQPPELDLSWFVPAATTRLSITNQSNYAATIHLQGMDRGRQCDFTFYTGGSALEDGIMGTAHLILQPGQTVTVPVEVRTRQRPLIGLVPRLTPFRLVARMDTEPPLRRAADGQLAVAALIGPWQMALAALLGVVALFGTGLAGLALLVALRSASPATSVPPVAAATPAPAAPVVAFVIQMDQQMPTRIPAAPGSAMTAPSSQQDAPAVANQAPAIPVVSADQITAPGEPTPVGQQPLRPVVVTTPAAQRPTTPGDGAAPAQANTSSLTYGQMFKEVATAFDLDWRVLAAQAYLESGFDSLALSGQGDMGLMQIRPGTWNEWAPTVDASDPFDSYSNVLVGAVYLNHLREELSARGLPQQEWMLVAYNWGPEKVFAHVDAGGTWETLDAERRQYADDILRIAASIPPS
jgi:soluble lytic murein transglycosylase-like protein